MGNYGKRSVILGLLFLVIGIPLSTKGIGIGFLLTGVGAFLMFIGLPRFVQGSDRKVLGKIKRSKAEARGSLIWALYFFNLTPFYIPGSNLFRYLNTPFIAELMFSEYKFWARPQLPYQWVPFVYVGFSILFFLGLILSKKIPKTVNIVFKTILLICFAFWVSFAIQLFNWSILADPTLVDFYTLTGLYAPNLLAARLVLGIVSLSISIPLMLKMIKKVGESFANLNVRGSKKLILYITYLAFNLFGIFPLYYGGVSALENNSYIFPLINYISLILLAIILFRVFFTILNSLKDFAHQHKGSKTESDLVGASPIKASSAIFLVLFFIAWAPVFLPLIDQGENSKFNSIYNESWSGWSNFKDNLETQGYETMSVQSSLNTINSLETDKHIVLAIGGPNKFYSPSSEIPFLLMAFKMNFSMMICADQGTAENLLLQTFIASVQTEEPSPFTIIPNGILHDNSSYYKDPKFPVISSFSTHPINNGIDNVVLSYASGFLGGQFMNMFGWTQLGFTSGSYSFIDKNNDGMYDQKVDVHKLPQSFTDIMADNDDEMMQLTGAILEKGFPLGGYAQSVFAIKEIYPPGSVDAAGNQIASRIFCATDASWLNNELTQIPSYDNLQMGMNVIDWLSCGRTPENTIVIFDEAHIRAESGVQDLSSAGSFGLLLGYVSWASTNPILGLVYPLFAIRSLSKYLPKEDKKRKLQLRDLEEAERNKAMLKFRTSSFFAKKINWYRENKKYQLALIQLYRRVERKVNRMLGASADRGVSAIMEAINRERSGSISKDNSKRLKEFFKKMIDIKENKINIEKEQEFEGVFMEMNWVNDFLTRR